MLQRTSSEKDQKRSTRRHTYTSDSIPVHPLPHGTRRGGVARHVAHTHKGLNCVWHVAQEFPIVGILRSSQLTSGGGSVGRARGKPNLVTLEVRFPLSYPAIPPFVRIVTPRFQFHTGHVTVGGSICAEFLTTGGWKSTEMNLIYILRSVCNLLLEGNARVDAYGHPYTFQEAKEAFQRVASQHGWS